jgi:hypothetical protein
MQQWIIYYLPDNPNPIGLGYDMEVRHPNGHIERIPQIVHYFENN